MRMILGLFVTIAVGLAGGCGDDDGPPSTPRTGGMQITVLQGTTPIALSTVVVSPTGVSGEATDRVVTTNQLGQSTVDDLPGGTYSVTASKSVSGILHFGETTSVTVSSGSTTTVIVVLVEAQSDYFPLALGNWWAFDSSWWASDGLDTLEVGAIKLVDDVATYTIGPRGPNFHPGYHTHGRNAIYQHGYETTTGSDHVIRPPTVWIDFTATAGECWTIRDWGQGCLHSEWETVQTSLGEFTSCWKVTLREEYGEVEVTFWLKDGIGPVKVLMNGSESFLTDFELK